MPTTPVKCEIYHSSQWNDYTAYLTGFKIEERGISMVPRATVNLFGEDSNFATYLSSPYKLIKLSVDGGSGFYTPFWGYVNCPRMKAIAGTAVAKRKLSLDCSHAAQRLAVDHITFDYYALQSAISPKTGAEAWSFRKMIEDFLLYPDSTQDGTGLSGTGFTLEADVDANGIDHNIDTSCTWNGQTLLEALRTAADRIGYDGYFYTDDSNAKIYLNPFDKSSIATLSNFIGEPDYNFGDINDLANVIFVKGGIDVGVPTDGDRWTCYSATKYSPPAWSATTDDGNVSLSDVDNTNLGVYAKNAKSLKFSCDSVDSWWINAVLDITQTDELVVDCKNRCRTLAFAVYANVGSNTYSLTVQLEDSSGNKINYCFIDKSLSSVAMFESQTVKSFLLPVGIDQPITLSNEVGAFFYLITEQANNSKANYFGGKWFYHEGSTTFDWEHVVKLQFWFGHLISGATTWNVEIDGIQFIGGYEIAPFRSYSATLNPPNKDATSIATYGTHVFPVNDASIASFEQAIAEGARVLANLKDPIPSFDVIKGVPNATWLLPSNVITIGAIDYRIAGMTYDWASVDKRCKVKYNLVTKTSPLPPIWTQINELRFHVK